MNSTTQLRQFESTGSNPREYGNIELTASSYDEGGEEPSLVLDHLEYMDDRSNDEEQNENDSGCHRRFVLVIDKCLWGI